MKTRLLLFAVATCAALCAIHGTARAQIFVENSGNGDPGTGSIAEYTTSGALVNPAFISGLTDPGGIAISGDKLFVANGGMTISEYTTSGVLVNPSLISGLTGPSSLAVSGGFLYVVTSSLHGEADRIGKYTISGATVNATLIDQLGDLTDIKVRGNNLFVSDVGVDEYTTSGAFVKPVVSGFSNQGCAITLGIALSGDNLFLGSFDFCTQIGTIGEYTTSGATVNGTLISGPIYPYSLAVSGGDLFVTNLNAGTIGEYTTSGATVNAALISEPNGLGYIDVVPESVPDASSTWTLLLLGLTAMFGLTPLLRRPA